MNSLRSLVLSLVALGVGLCLVSACGTPRSAGKEKVTPVYNKDTGKLEEIGLDRNGDGKVDTRAFMDGVKLKSIALDRNNDGTPDRWEYYAPNDPAAGAGFNRNTALVRADEANGPDPKKITRRESYEKGVLQRVEEDSDNDGRVDTWTTYEGGALARVEIDTRGLGKPDRRLVYVNGAFDHVEVDRLGDGHFERVQKGQ